MKQMRVLHGMMNAIVLLSMMAVASTQVSLRNRVDSNRTFQGVFANCVLEFLNAGGYTYVAFGGVGVAFYRYQTGNQPQRIGYHCSAALSSVVDLASGPFGSLACVNGNGDVYLLSLRTSDLSLVPHGVAVSGGVGLNAARARALRDLDIGNSAYLIVGTRTGRLRVYRLSSSDGRLPTAPELNARLNVGSPLVDLPLFSDAVRALTAWESAGQQYIAVGGADGMVYLYRFVSGSVTLVGKAMYHPAPVEEMVVNGNRLIVGLRSGLVYVWNYTSSSVTHHLTLKEPWSPLTAYSLCALPGDRVAVATGSVRVYSLANGAQVGEYGVQTGKVVDCPDYYYGWYGLATPYSIMSRVVTSTQSMLRLAPFVGAANSYLYVAGVSAHMPTSFLPPPSGLQYQATLTSAPVYAVASLPTGAPPIAYGSANGEVRVPWGTRNVGEPVYALVGTGSASQPWVLGSYGVGKMFAWNSSGTFAPNILPASGAPRILYGLRVIAYNASTNRVTFATTGGDGKVETWEWNASAPTTPATLLSSQSLSHPLHSLTVNASRDRLAVASVSAPFSSTARCAWTLPLSGSSIGAPTPINLEARVVAYHPTTADLLAWAGKQGWNGVIALWRSSAAQPHFLYRTFNGSYITWLDWTQNGALLASDSRGMVYALSPNGALNHPKNRDGTTNNLYYGNPSDALRVAYQPHRGFIYAVSAVGGNILTAGADGRAILFSNSGLPVYSSDKVNAADYEGMGLYSIDYLPNGGVVTNQEVVYPASGVRYALFPSPPAYAAFWIPNTSAAVYTNPVTQEIVSNQLRVAQAFVSSNNPSQHIYGDFGYRVELAESGSYALAVRLEGRGGGAPGLARAWILARSTSFPYFSGNRYILYEYTSTSDPALYALSPSGDWIALTASTTTINIYQRSEVVADNPRRHSFLSYSSAINFRALKFLADDVLAVAHQSGGTIVLDVWQRSGATWTQRQSINTGISVVDTAYFFGYVLDAVPSGSIVRVALGGANAIVFYRMDRPAGAPSLTEVGRATAASNGYLDIPFITWVRFSRQNPNVLGVVQSRQVAITYDLTGLFSW
jgi:WD40 repeat protein